ncbi:hypothetical protein KCU90_g29, partial [Aureobasidium melanogenum]
LLDLDTAINPAFWDEVKPVFGLSNEDQLIQIVRVMSEFEAECRVKFMVLPVFGVCWSELRQIVGLGGPEKVVDVGVFG